MLKKFHFIPPFLHKVHNIIILNTRHPDPDAPNIRLRDLSIDDHAYLLNLYMDQLFKSLFKDGTPPSIGKRYGSFSFDPETGVRFNPSHLLRNRAIQHLKKLLNPDHTKDDDL